MTMLAAALLLAAAFVFAGLDAAWQALDPVRLRHRADKGDRRAQQMMAWAAVRPQADLVLAWTSHALAAAALVIFASGTSGRTWWVVAWAIPVYALLVQVVARQVFRRLPFMVLSRMWWLVAPAGSFWAPLARPLARLLRQIKEDPLPRLPAGEELMALAEKTEGISPLEQSMLRSVMDFRRLTAAGLALPVEYYACVEADRTLAEMLGDRRSAEARHTLVLAADGAPLGVVEAAAAALSGALSARAQSFARPMLSFPADLPAWKVLVRLRRSPTPVAEVRDEETGRFLGIVTEEVTVARLLGQAV